MTQQRRAFLRKRKEVAIYLCRVYGYDPFAKRICKPLPGMRNPAQWTIYIKQAEELITICNRPVTHPDQERIDYLEKFVDVSEDGDFAYARLVLRSDKFPYLRERPPTVREMVDKLMKDNGITKPQR